jgi:hypothetical protein
VREETPSSVLAFSKAEVTLELIARLKEEVEKGDKGMYTRMVM